MPTAKLPAIDKDGKPASSLIVTGSNASACLIKVAAAKASA